MENVVMTRFFGGGRSNLSSLSGIGAGSEPFRAATQKKQQRGFTLAEVLITLGIIGVVAAMTIPAVVNKYQKAVFLNRIKTTNAILSEVMTRAVADYGDVSEWDFGSQVNTHNATAVASKYFVPYLKQIKEAGYCKKNSGVDDKSSYCITLANGVNIRFMLDGTQGQIQSTLYLICSLKNENGRFSLSEKGRNYSRTDFLFRINKIRQKETGWVILIGVQ